MGVRVLNRLIDVSLLICSPLGSCAHGTVPQFVSRPSGDIFCDYMCQELGAFSLQIFAWTMGYCQNLLQG
jgi:hypothetical protein